MLYFFFLLLFQSYILQHYKQINQFKFDKLIIFIHNYFYNLLFQNFILFNL